MTWIEDSDEPGRHIGWVEEPAPEYVRDVMRIAVRKRQPNGPWGIAVLISPLLPAEVCELTGDNGEQPLSSRQVLLAHVRLYDQRGGGVETSFKSDKQGLGIGKRSKKRFEAQQMVMLLGSLVHNVVIWARQWFARSASPLQHYGPMRMVHDVSGFLLVDNARPHPSDGVQSGCPSRRLFARPFARAVRTHPCHSSPWPNRENGLFLSYDSLAYLTKTHELVVQIMM